MKDITVIRTWTRSQEGWLAGVCQGLGERFDINPGLLRLIWLGSILFLGVGLLLYFVFAFCLPVEGRESNVLEPRFLGVCSRIALKTDMDVGLLRVLTVLIGLGSLGLTIVAYFIIHFLVPRESV